MDTKDIGRWVGIGMRFIPILITLIGTIERVSGGTSAQKKQAVLDAVDVILPTLELSIGRDALKDPAVKEAISRGIDAIVAIQNTIEAVQDAQNK